MRKEKVVLLWVLQHLLNFVERVIHIFYAFCLFWTHSSYPRFNFFLAEVLIFQRHFFHFTLDVLLTHLFEVSAKQNRCTGSAPMAHTSPPSFPASRLFTLHPSVGAITCPPLIPAQPHTLSKTTFIPQCTCIPHVSNSPTMPSVYRSYNAPGSCESRSLSSFSFLFLSAPHFGDIHIIYFMTEDSI